LAKPKKAIRT